MYVGFNYNFSKQGIKKIRNSRREEITLAFNNLTLIPIYKKIIS